MRPDVISDAIGAVPSKAPPGVLGEIVARTLADVAERARAVPAPGPRPDAPRPFAAALRGPGLSLIAEYKPRSPSRGAIRPDATPEAIADAYRPYAAAISCLVDGPYFGGGYDALRRIRAVTHQPVLAKGFFVTAYQVREAAAAGADAILLMASLLPPESLARLAGLARGAGLGALVEVHDADELAEVSALDVEVIGVNSRDLTTLKIDLGRARRLLARVPQGRLRIAESGLACAADIDGVRGLADGILIGSALMAAPDPGRRIVELGLAGRLTVKICGVRRPEDAAACIAARADFAGINLAARFRRSVDVTTARQIVEALAGSGVIPVGVFLDQPIEAVAEIAGAVGLRWVQLHGDESVADCAALADRRFEVIKALTAETAYRAHEYAPYVVAFLLDGRRPGSGETWDPRRVALPPVQGLLAGRPVWLAGGLDPENVGAAVGCVSVAGVDVASGVERDGQLAADRIRDFVRAARAAAVESAR